MAIDFSYLGAAAPQPQQAPQNDLANITLRVDADAMLLCDGEHIDIELKAGVVKKTQLPVGQHLLEFLSVENPDAKIEKEVDFPDASKNYLVMANGLKEALAQFESKAAAALGAKRVFKLVITGYENEMSAMMVVRNIFGCSIAEARTKLAALPAVVIESEDKARVEALAGQFFQGNVSAVVETRNGYGELVDSDSYEITGTEYFNTAEDYYEKENYEEAVKFYHKAAEKDNADAMYKLGDCYYRGRGVEKDREEAIKWYRKAAEQGNADAMYKLGECYSHGRGVEEDYDEADKWYCKVAEKYRKAADKGNANAMYKLGKCYSWGNGVKYDNEEAVKWYRKAAGQGNADAMYELGDCYYNGNGVEEDKEEGVKWYRKAAEKYRKAAEQGNAGAMFKLGDCYFFGLGVEEDKEEAVKWYRKTAEKGDADAMYWLGRCYECGDGVEEDDDEAYKWYRKAAEQGNAEAENYFE